jgi:hypothetical protein
MSGLRGIEVFALLLLAGCAASTHPVAPIAGQLPPPRVEPAREEARSTEITSNAPAPVPAIPAAIEPVQAAKLSTNASAPQGAKQPAALLPGTRSLPGPVSKAALPATSPNPVPAATVQPKEPTLDIASLQTRLRNTDAIGMFTKLALKNQVDTLMEQFRAHYQGTQKTSLTELRQPYDMLVMKVLALLQDEDPPLAKMILGSREAMWNILADREKFNAVI